MRAFEHHGAGVTRFECLLPPHGADAPLVTVAKPSESVGRDRCGEVVPLRGREGKEILGDTTADDVHTGVVAVVLATPGAVIAGHWIEGAGQELGSEHVDLVHAPITARSLVVCRTLRTATPSLGW